MACDEVVSDMNMSSMVSCRVGGDRKWRVGGMQGVGMTREGGGWHALQDAGGGCGMTGEGFVDVQLVCDGTSTVGWKGVEGT